MSDYPKDYLYSKEHEWVHVEDDVCTLGITSYAQKELGEVVFVELPEVGASYEAGDELGSIESVKAVAELYTPVTGEVVEVNDAVTDDPEVLNDDPHGDGWLVRLKIGSRDDLEGLMKHDEYLEHIGEDG